MTMLSSLEWMQQELDELKHKSQFRELKVTETENASWIRQGEGRLLNLSSNNYLGLHITPELARSVLSHWTQQGLGSTASRLIVGNHPLYAEAEQRLAQSKQVESALIFPNGYMANVGIISSIVGRHDTVFSDRLNHASIVDGIVLSRARMERYRHNDMDHLESLLRKADKSPTSGKKLIVTDTVFSMDGHIAPLKELVDLKNRYGAMLMIDEAHSGGIYGPHGEGLAFHEGLHEQIEVHMGTFSKAYGCYGAYVVGTRLMTDYLINKSRSFIYTTGLPPLVLSSILTAMEQVEQGDELRKRLRENMHFFQYEMNAMGFDTFGSETQIIPAVVGRNADAVAFAKALFEEGISAVAIRPPTVPEGSARIRFTVTAAHTRDELTWALDKIGKTAARLGLIGRAEHA